MRKKAIEFLNLIREQELNAMEIWLQPLTKCSAKLLEIGGGNGLLAKCLVDMGFDVVSIDPEPRQKSYFPVRRGDCRHLEFDNESFDIIFSSNVLEHVVDLPIGLREMKRVLKPGGIMIHTMPTPFNTILTMLTQPIGYFLGIFTLIEYAAKLMSSIILSKKHSFAEQESQNCSVPQTKPLQRRHLVAIIKSINLLRLIISPPHGTSPSCFAELRDWKPETWCRKFQQEDLHVKAVVNLPYAYSRHGILPFLFVGIRRWLAAAGKTSCLAYVITF